MMTKEQKKKLSEMICSKDLEISKLGLVLLSETVDSFLEAEQFIFEVNNIDRNHFYWFVYLAEGCHGTAQTFYWVKQMDFISQQLLKRTQEYGRRYKTEDRRIAGEWAGGDV